MTKERIEKSRCGGNKLFVNLRQSVVICERNYRELEISQVTTGFKVILRTERKVGDTRQYRVRRESGDKREHEQ